MLLTKNIEVSLHGDRIKYYENLGYIIPREERVKIYKGKTYKYFAVPKNSKITIDVKDLSEKSNVLVEVKCDNCDSVYKIKYHSYLEHKDKDFGDLCKKCSNLKRERTVKEKYGVKNVSNIHSIREKAKNTMVIKYGENYSDIFIEKMKKSLIQKYGVDNISKLDEVKDKKENTFLLRYGVKCPFQLDGVSEKTKETNMKRYGTEYIFQNEDMFNTVKSKIVINKTSKPQIKLFKMLNKHYNCLLNYGVKRYSLDCLVIINDIKIDVEFDGQYWHDNTESIIKDNIRDNYCFDNGIKVLRIKGNNIVPNESDIINAINELLNKDIMYKEIYTDWK